jgi:superfamily II DNA or RNA helicase
MKLFDYQQAFLDDVVAQPAPVRSCLYYRTGAGKTLTALLGLVTLGHSSAVVIAPPATQSTWVEAGRSVGVDVEVMSHAKFRMKTTKLSRTTAVIADEFHLFGGQKGQGWRRLDTLALHLQAPLFLLSATPNYNDAERCYCVAHILDPNGTKGGYLQFIYENCTTEQNPFGMEPKVTGFKRHADAAEFLSSMKHVYYVPDDTVFSIDDVPYQVTVPYEFDVLNLDRRRSRVMASQMEKRHALLRLGLLDDAGRLRPEVLDTLLAQLTDADGALLFSASSTVARAIAAAFAEVGVPHGILTGADTQKQKTDVLAAMRDGRLTTLIGTATLATGTDGLDKVCNTLIIVADTDDDALRRQLVGRILPRGAVSDAGPRKILRMTPILR